VNESSYRPNHMPIHYHIIISWNWSINSMFAHPQFYRPDDTKQTNPVALSPQENSTDRGPPLVDGSSNYYYLLLLLLLLLITIDAVSSSTESVWLLCWLNLLSDVGALKFSAKTKANHWIVNQLPQSGSRCDKPNSHRRVNVPYTP
jgi:hypothetical protein